MHRAARLFAHGVNQDAVLPDATPHFAGRVIILRAPRCHSTLPPLSPSVCPDYRKLSTIIPPYTRIHRSKRSAISFHSIPFACHAIDFEDVRYTSRGTRRDIVGPERECYWRKNSSRHELRGYFLSFRFRPTRLGIVSSSSSGIFNGDDL